MGEADPYRARPVYPFGDRAPAPGSTLEIADGLTWVRIGVPGPLRHVNCWILDDGDGVALVDTGMNTADARATWKAVTSAVLAGRPVTRVIGTHFHPDHIGLAGWMCAHHDCPLTMTRGEWLYARMLIADARDTVPPEMIAQWRMMGWDGAQVDTASARGWAGFRRIVTPLPLGYIRIADDDRLRIGTRDWRVVIGSGHSPEHACLLDEANGILIAGDQVLPRISPNVSVTVSEPDADPLGEWLASIARLQRLPHDLLVLPGHGDAFTGLHPRLAAMAAEHHARLDSLAALLAAPRRVVDCFGVLFERPIGSDMLGMASGEALAHLRRLEVEGRAVRTLRDGVGWWQAA